MKQKQANHWGLFDMSGNVWEWTEDHWHDSYEGAPIDGSAWQCENKSARRVVRGGSWGDYTRRVRSAARLHYALVDRLSTLGFRCARVQGELRPRSGGYAEHQELAGLASGDVEQAKHRHSPDRAALVRVAAESGSARLVIPETASVSTSAPPAAGIIIRSDQASMELRRIRHDQCPWASAMGRDRFGLWSEFEFQQVTQRMRWIPPGRFMMGSPEDEPGRYDWEGPVHPVVLENGFWLFDTPVTQAFYEAVMDDNPSYYISPDRPVERVSYEQAGEFIERLNVAVRGLDVCLPNESQWEYACRAGSTTALYNGPIDIIGACNAPALDSIAWYAGNSGEGYDLEKGVDLSKYRKEFQYTNPKSGTWPVGLKDGNAWGLYDMLGNVWEWTADHWHESYEGAPEDGSAWQSEDQDARRVVRGGSWYDFARDVRSAMRDRLAPDDRDDYLGFRCARVQP